MRDIYDIRQDSKSIRLQDDIIQGLSESPPSLPSLLIWDDRGQQLFDQFSQTPSYYPFHSKLETITKYAADIGRGIPGKSALIELGCGPKNQIHSIRLQPPEKNSLLLRSRRLPPGPDQQYNRPLQGDGRAQVYENHRPVGDIRRLHCMARAPDSLPGLESTAFLWMENSIANFAHISQAGSFLSRFIAACRQADLHSQFLTDVCQQKGRIAKAYSPEIDGLRSFIMNGLSQANSFVRYDLVDLQDWGFEAEVCSTGHEGMTLTVYYTALRDLMVFIHGGPVVLFWKGQRIKIIRGEKWTEALMGMVSFRAGLQVQQKWIDSSGIYCIYSLLPEA